MHILLNEVLFMMRFETFSIASLKSVKLAKQKVGSNIYC